VIFCGDGGAGEVFFLYVCDDDDFEQYNPERL
jgi:hypothetical protein